MSRIISYILLASITLVLTTACKSDPSLQSYYLANKDKSDFYAQSIPKAVLGIVADSLSTDARKGFASIEKVNVLVYPKKDNNAAQLAKEAATVQAIFLNPDYKTLMTHSEDATKMRVAYDGSKDAIDEVVIYGTSPDVGLGIARIMGDDMNISNILKMMQEMDVSTMDSSALGNIMKTFSKNSGLDK